MIRHVLTVILPAFTIFTIIGTLSVRTHTSSLLYCNVSLIKRSGKAAMNYFTPMRSIPLHSARAIWLQQGGGVGLSTFLIFRFSIIYYYVY
ncbi:unnamed protein product [Ceratitis capitata]|uniref:(Mediterranean fruit fly) hypothetical protein n=1 Tax=Ceratitis capitata TaxID=7213 RepID=A0A811UY76_CERCA|nr:unnamed protein product [Ceratitis capitata]